MMQGCGIEGEDKEAGRGRRWREGVSGAGVGRNGLTAGGELALEMGKEGDLPLMDSARGAGRVAWLRLTEPALLC